MAHFSFTTDTLVYQVFDHDKKMLLKKSPVKEHEAHYEEEIIEVPFCVYSAIRDAFRAGEDNKSMKIAHVLGIG